MSNLDINEEKTRLEYEYTVEPVGIALYCFFLIGSLIATLYINCCVYDNNPYMQLLSLVLNTIFVFSTVMIGIPIIRRYIIKIFVEKEIENSLKVINYVKSTEEKNWNPSLIQGQIRNLLSKTRFDDLSIRINEIDKSIKDTGRLTLDNYNNFIKTLSQIISILKIKNKDNTSEENLDSIKNDLNNNLESLKNARFFYNLYSLLNISLPLTIMTISIFIINIQINLKNPIVLIALMIIGFSVLKYVISPVLRSFTEKTNSDLDDLSVPIIITILGSIVLFYGIKEIINNFPSEIIKLYMDVKKDLIVDVNNEVYTIVLALIFWWILNYIWRNFIIRIMRNWAKKTEQKYDDIIVEILNWFGVFMFGALMFGYILVKIDIFNQGDQSSDIILPYTILMSVITAIVGISTKETLQNFFAGILMQIDRPFNIGERLVLETGEICDAREFGMRSSIFYNVLENTQVSIPNIMLSKMKITNISKPDYQLRITMKFHVNHNTHKINTKDYTSLEIIQTLLLFLSYRNSNITQLLIDNNERDDLKDKNYPYMPNDDSIQRSNISDALIKLKEQYPTLKTNIDNIETEYLEKFKENRKKTYEIIQGGIDTYIDKMDAILDYNKSFSQLVNEIYKLKTIKYIKTSSLETLINEIDREPTVSSEFKITNTGVSYIEVSLSCFTVNLENKYETEHLIHSEVIKHLTGKLGKYAIIG